MTENSRKKVFSPEQWVWCCTDGISEVEMYIIQNLAHKLSERRQFHPNSIFTHWPALFYLTNIWIQVFILEFRVLKNMLMVIPQKMIFHSEEFEFPYSYPHILNLHYLLLSSYVNSSTIYKREKIKKTLCVSLQWFRCSCCMILFFPSQDCLIGFWIMRSS